jgi:hypothetical protein
MARCGDVSENKVTGERGVVLRAARTTTGNRPRCAWSSSRTEQVVGEHIHPNPRAGQTRPYKSCRPSKEEEFNDGNA